MAIAIISIFFAFVLGFGTGAMVGYIRCTIERDTYADRCAARTAAAAQVKTAPVPAPAPPVKDAPI